MDHFDFVGIVISSCYLMVPTCVDGARLTAVSSYGRELFENVRKDNLGEEPTEEDPRIRERVCEDIGSSGFFRRMNSVPIDARKIYDNKDQEKYARVYRLIYSKLYYKYVNPYRKWRIQSVRTGDSIEEYVFVCPFEQQSSDYSLKPVYVTREYHVGPFKEPHKPGRFLFGILVHGAGPPIRHTWLAEEPALDLNTNVELHYLRLREHIQLAVDKNIDPLCKLISDNADNDQYLRLCAAVLKSPYFEDNVAYPTTTNIGEHRCGERRISFQTEEGEARANGRSFREWMIHCHSTYLDTQRKFFLFISRAYMTNQVFVYLQNRFDSRIYLENLSTGIAVVDELNSFDLPEA